MDGKEIKRSRTHKGARTQTSCCQLTKITKSVNRGQGDLGKASSESKESNVRDGVVPHLLLLHDRRIRLWIYGDHLPGVLHDALHRFEEPGGDRR
uniref:Uncharacterized protein n=1 Tax=Arundo donax TaxID=35708 RepID=A0A0A8YY13_ARUDO